MPLLTCHIPRGGGEEEPYKGRSVGPTYPPTWLPPKWPRSCCDLWSPLHPPFPKFDGASGLPHLSWVLPVSRRGLGYSFCGTHYEAAPGHAPGCLPQPHLFYSHTQGSYLWKWGRSLLCSELLQSSMGFLLSSDCRHSWQQIEGDPHSQLPISTSPASLFSTHLVELYLGQGEGQWEVTLFLGHSTFFLSTIQSTVLMVCRWLQEGTLSPKLGVWHIISLQWDLMSERMIEQMIVISMCLPSWIRLLPRITLEKVPRNLIW